MHAAQSLHSRFSEGTSWSCGPSRVHNGSQWSGTETERGIGCDGMHWNAVMDSQVGNSGHHLSRKQTSHCLFVSILADFDVYQSPISGNPGPPTIFSTDFHTFFQAKSRGRLCLRVSRPAFLVRVPGCQAVSVVLLSHLAVAFCVYWPISSRFRCTAFCHSAKLRLSHDDQKPSQTTT